MNNLRVAYKAGFFIVSRFILIAIIYGLNVKIGNKELGMI